MEVVRARLLGSGGGFVGKIGFVGGYVNSNQLIAWEIKCYYNHSASDLHLPTLPTKPTKLNIR